jgi:rubrerythrin
VDIENIDKSKFKSQYKPKYYIWCAACGYEKTSREKLKRCPNCKTVLHEKRYLM